MKRDPEVLRQTCESPIEHTYRHDVGRVFDDRMKLYTLPLATK